MALINKQKNQFWRNFKKIFAPEFVSYLSHWSQIGILIVAVWGYFYTILPVYNKAVLEKQIASLKDKEEQLGKNIINLENQTKTLKNELEKTYNAVKKAALEGLQSELIFCSVYITNMNTQVTLDPSIVLKEVDDCIELNSSKSVYLEQINDNDKKKIISQVVKGRQSFRENASKVIKDMEKSQKDLEQRANGLKDADNAARAQFLQDMDKGNTEYVQKLNDVLSKVINNLAF